MSAQKLRLAKAGGKRIARISDSIILAPRTTAKKISTKVTKCGNAP